MVRTRADSYPTGLAATSGLTDIKTIILSGRGKLQIPQLAKVDLELVYCKLEKFAYKSGEDYNRLIVS